MGIDRRSCLLAIAGIGPAAVLMLGMPRGSIAAERTVGPISNQVTSIFGFVSSPSGAATLSVRRVTSRSQKTEEPASPIAQRNHYPLVEMGIPQNPPAIEMIHQK
jgi:hypothetical protein